MAKKGRKNTTTKTTVPANAQNTPSVHNGSAAAAAPAPQPPVLCGAVSGVLYENIFKPALVSLWQRCDEEPLRALVESIATSIAMRDSYDGCRRMDNIFQRYLYYLESRQASSDGDALLALCDYWRCQTLVTLFRDSGLIFDLLFPGGTAELVAEARIPRNSLIRGLQGIAQNCVGGPACSPKLPPQAEILDFVHGISTPWSGFPAAPVFGLLNDLPEKIAVTRADAEKMDLKCTSWATSGTEYLEFYSSKVSKAVSVGKAAAMVGCDASQIVAVGDGCNDIPMIRFAGLGVAMGNAAPDEVKEAADYVTDTNMNDGVAKLIREKIL